MGFQEGFGVCWWETGGLGEEVDELQDEEFRKGAAEI